MSRLPTSLGAFLVLLLAGCTAVRDGAGASVRLHVSGSLRASERRLDPSWQIEWEPAGIERARQILRRRWVRFEGTAEAIDGFLAQIALLPAEHLEQMALRRVRLLESRADLRREWMREHPFSRDLPNGWYNSWRETITIYRECPAAITLHEVGHAVQNGRSRATYLKLGQAILPFAGDLSPYAKRDEKEAFAEAYARWATCGLCGIRSRRPEVAGLIARTLQQGTGGPGGPDAAPEPFGMDMVVREPDSKLPSRPTGERGN